jgi:hypothetical protein
MAPIARMHEDASMGQRVLIVDDLLATGGTACARATWCGASAGMSTPSRFSSSCLPARPRQAAERAIHSVLQSTDAT